MLKYLNISKFAVIDRLSLTFQSGLNLLTGETGSGKSIIVDALGLLLGARSSSQLIRTGELSSMVEGYFELKGDQLLGVKESLESLGIELYEDGLIVRREISASGKSRVFINDKSVTLATLKGLQPLLAEIHGQGEQQSLLSAQSQLELLDSFGGCIPLSMEVKELFNLWDTARDDLLKHREEMNQLELARDFVQFQLNEIESVNPVEGEDELLETEKKVLTHAEQVLRLKSSIYENLYEADESVLSHLGAIQRQIDELAEIDGRVKPAADFLRDGVAALLEVVDLFRSYGDQAAFSPARLAAVEQRLAELDRLKRKYKADVSGLLKIKDQLYEHIQSLASQSDEEKRLNEKLIGLQNKYLEKAEILSACRRDSIQRFEQAVSDGLRQVALDNAIFRVNHETVYVADGSNGSEFSTQGLDKIFLLLSANPGESLKPLSQIASGGELSRIMLTLRTMSREKQSGNSFQCDTMVFDEIDVGIGGRVAEAVGRRLKTLSEAHQVLCVTHQPQIAKFADHHLYVTKEIKAGRTVTNIKALEGEERVGELSRMIAGVEDSQTTREAARWMLKESSKNSPVRKRAKKP
ncbi:MAG: DNA repair protein RecN [Acidobacteria bacterium 13_1_20CM_3_53_8]|nr:MAG: DNA repair protein RecN [Acidobacteria bacterium 13_1_20CM_3_53_8]